jgi:hypothetical protein
MLAIHSVLERHMSELMGISLVLAPFSLALSLSASAYAYRELAGTPIAARNAGA